MFHVFVRFGASWTIFLYCERSSLPSLLPLCPRFDVVLSGCASFSSYSSSWHGTFQVFLQSFWFTYDVDEKLTFLDVVDSSRLISVSVAHLNSLCPCLRQHQVGSDAQPTRMRFPWKPRKSAAAENSDA